MSVGQGRLCQDAKISTTKQIKSIMKKLALLALVAPAFAGTPAPVVAAAPAPAPAPCCTNLELGFGYNFASKDLLKHSDGISKEIDTVGIDLTAVHRLTDNHALTLRIAGTQGSEMNRNVIFVGPDAYDDTCKYTLRTISVMPGYRYTTPVSEKTSLFCGVNVGIVNQEIQEKFSAPIIGGGADMKYCNAADAWGIAATAEAGVRYQICPCTEIFAAYQFSGNTAKCSTGGAMPTIKAHRQIHNGVRAGFTFKF